jgi:hypothetical protein
MECRTTALALLSSIAIWVVGTACASQARAQGPTRQRLSEAGTMTLSRQLDAAVARGDTPGVVALVVDRKGVLYEGSAGKLDGARNLPMASDAIFRIASMTKPITSVAIMMLLEQGELRLDDPGGAEARGDLGGTGFAEGLLLAYANRDAIPFAADLQPWRDGDGHDIWASQRCADLAMECGAKRAIATSRRTP